MKDMQIDSLNLVFKPTNACNMRCTYCYHAEKGYTNNKMDIKTFELFCSKVFPFVNKVGIIWHGGEPLLMGLDFYKKAFEIIEKYKRQYNNQVKLTFQTNGTLIDKQWIDFFKLHGTGVGLSFDGLQNDETRGHTDEILNVFKLLRNKGQNFGVIQVLNSETVERVLDNYEYYKNLNINIKFNCVFDTALISKQKELLISSKKYIDRMNEFFDYWILDTKCNIMVDPFDEYIRLYFKKSKVCRHNSCLLHWMSIDNNGNITPCGRNYPEEFAMGNIVDYDNITKAFQSPGYINLLKQTIARRDDCLKKCQFYEYCKGGCNNDKLLEGGIDMNGGFSCQIFKGVFVHIKEVLDELLSQPIDIGRFNPYFARILKQLGWTINGFNKF